MSDTRKSSRASDHAPRNEQDNETAALPEDVQAERAQHSSEGGGPWPAEYLEQHLSPRGPLVAFAPEQNYTSHEEQ